MFLKWRKKTGKLKKIFLIVFPAFNLASGNYGLVYITYCEITAYKHTARYGRKLQVKGAWRWPGIDCKCLSTKG